MVFVMTLTSSFMVLIMIMIWKTNIFLVIPYVLVIGSVELLYLSSVLYKFDQGGYLPLAFALVLMFIMFVWNDVYQKKYCFELEHKVSPDKVKDVVLRANSHRMPGLALFYSELVQGIPPIFEHYLANVPALHSILVFVSIKTLPISKVPVEERFLFRRAQPNDLNVFRCVVRYGYTDVHNEKEPFDGLLVERLKRFIMEDYMFSRDNNQELLDKYNQVDDGAIQVESTKYPTAVERDMDLVDNAWHAGVVHLLGEHDVVAAKGASTGKRFMIDYAYNFLKRNVRQSNKVFDVPHKRMLKVGMTYEL